MNARTDFRNLIYPGTICTITSGPLTDYEACVLAFEDENGKVLVKTQIYGRQTRIELDADALKPISTPKTLLMNAGDRNLSVEISLDGLSRGMGTELLFVQNGLLWYAGDDEDLYIVCHLGSLQNVRYIAGDDSGLKQVFLEFDTYIIYFDVTELGSSDPFKVFFPRMKRLLTGHQARTFMRERALSKVVDRMPDVEAFLDSEHTDTYISGLCHELSGLSKMLDELVKSNSAELATREEAISLIARYIALDGKNELDEEREYLVESFDAPIYPSFQDAARTIRNLARLVRLFGLSTSRKQ